MSKEIIYVSYWGSHTYGHSGTPSNGYSNFGVYVQNLIEYLKETPLTELVNGDEREMKKLDVDEFEALQAINDLSNACKIAQMSSLEKSVEELESKTSPITGPASFLERFEKTMKKIRDVGSRREPAQPTESQ